MKLAVSRIMLVAAGLAALAAPAMAGTIPYPSIGSANPITYAFTAAATGDLMAYTYIQSSAGDDEDLGLLVNGTSTTIFGLNDHTSAAGTSLDFGSVTAGDALVFFIRDHTTGQNWYSDPSLNPSSENHVYSTDAPANGTAPAGTYVGFEDTGFGSSDKNYADLQFVFTNTATAQSGGAIPEPATMALLGSAAFGLSALRSKRRRLG